MDQSKPTPEEIKKFEEQMTAHYTEALPFLRLKAEHDSLQADIAESRIRALHANNAFHKHMLAQEEANDKKKLESETPK